eukprot:Rmarinus@m.9650
MLLPPRMVIARRWQQPRRFQQCRRLPRRRPGRLRSSGRQKKIEGREMRSKDTLEICSKGSLKDTLETRSKDTLSVSSGAISSDTDGGQGELRVISLSCEARQHAVARVEAYKTSRMMRSHAHHHITVVPGISSGSGQNTAGQIPMYTAHHYTHESSSDDEDDIDLGHEVVDRIDRSYVDMLSKQLISPSERFRFMSWLFRLADVDRDDKVSMEELTDLLSALHHDGINLQDLLFDDGDGGVKEVNRNLAERIMMEYHHDNDGYMSQTEFMVLADLVVREYMHYGSRHLDSVGRYELARCVGEGSEGVVRCALDVDSGDHYAMKIIPRTKCSNLSRLDREIQALTMLNHPNVVRIHSVLEDDNFIFIVMELCGGGSLFEHRNADSQPFTPEQARYYYTQLLDGLSYCHEHGVCHRDLRMDNLLLDNEGTLKISDFGHAGIFQKGWDFFSTSMVGSLYHLSPEQILGQAYHGEKVDVWSLGVLLYYMLTGQPPFYSEDTHVLLDSIKHARFEFSDVLSEDARDLLSHMLVPDPEQRCDLHFIRSHPWMQGPRSAPVVNRRVLALSQAMCDCDDAVLSAVITACEKRGLHVHIADPQDEGELWRVKCSDLENDVKFCIRYYNSCPTRQQQAADLDVDLDRDGDGDGEGDSAPALASAQADARPKPVLFSMNTLPMMGSSALDRYEATSGDAGKLLYVPPAEEREDAPSPLVSMSLSVSITSPPETLSNLHSGTPTVLATIVSPPTAVSSPEGILIEDPLLSTAAIDAVEEPAKRIPAHSRVCDSGTDSSPSDTGYAPSTENTPSGVDSGAAHLRMMLSELDDSSEKDSSPRFLSCEGGPPSSSPLTALTTADHPPLPEQAAKRRPERRLTPSQMLPRIVFKKHKEPSRVDSPCASDPMPAEISHPSPAPPPCTAPDVVPVSLSLDISPPDDSPYLMVRLLEGESILFCRLVNQLRGLIESCIQQQAASSISNSTGSPKSIYSTSSWKRRSRGSSKFRLDRSQSDSAMSFFSSDEEREHTRKLGRLYAHASPFKPFRRKKPPIPH